MRPLPTVARRLRQRGFTLIELLVSLTMLVVILGLLTAAVRIVAQGWERGTAIVSRQDMMARGLNALTRDLNGLRREVWQSRQGPGFVFNGGPDAMVYPVVEPPYPSLPGLYLARLSVKSGDNGNALVRTRMLMPPQSDGLDDKTYGDKVVLLEGPYTYRFSYHDPRRKGDPWRATWDDPKSLPDVVRLEVLDLAGDALMPVFQVRLEIDAEAGCISQQRMLCSPANRGTLPGKTLKQQGGPMR